MGIPKFSVNKSVCKSHAGLERHNGEWMIFMVNYPFKMVKLLLKTTVNATQSQKIKCDNIFQIPLCTNWLCPPSSMGTSSLTSLKNFSLMLLTLTTSLESMTWTATSLPPLTSPLSTMLWHPPLCKCATSKSHLESFWEFLKTPWNQKQSFVAFMSVSFEAIDM